MRPALTEFVKSRAKARCTRISKFQQRKNSLIGAEVAVWPPNRQTAGHDVECECQRRGLQVRSAGRPQAYRGINHRGPIPVGQRQALLLPGITRRFVLLAPLHVRSQSADSSSLASLFYPHFQTDVHQVCEVGAASLQILNLKSFFSKTLFSLLPTYQFKVCSTREHNFVVIQHFVHTQMPGLWPSWPSITTFLFSPGCFNKRSETATSGDLQLFLGNVHFQYFPERHKPRQSTCASVINLEWSEYHLLCRGACHLNLTFPRPTRVSIPQSYLRFLKGSLGREDTRRQLTLRCLFSGTKNGTAMKLREIPVHGS